MPIDHLQELLDEIAANHYPNAPATPEQIAAFEARAGWRLDDELRAFYLRANGACLFEPQPEQTFRILGLHEIQPIRATKPRQDDSAAAESWWTLVYLQDSDYNLVDVARPAPYPILDAYHETYPQQVAEIAPSFAVWLERTLRSGNQLWWLPGDD